MAGEPRHRHRGPDGAPGPVGMHVGARHGGPADARGHLVARHDGLEETRPVGAALLGHREGAGHHVNGGMSAAPAIALVHLERDAGGGVDERREQRIGLGVVADEGGGRPRGALGHGPRQPRVLGLRAAREHGAQRVEEHQPAPPRGRLAEPREGHLGGEARRACPDSACARACVSGPRRPAAPWARPGGGTGRSRAAARAAPDPAAPRRAGASSTAGRAPSSPRRASSRRCPCDRSR